jgi:MFS family permease
VVNAYVLTFAGFLLFGGRAADLFGRRRIYLFGLGLFTVASLAGGVAQGPGWLTAARAGWPRRPDERDAEGPACSPC